jgi:hypothetical protein
MKKLVRIKDSNIIGTVVSESEDTFDVLPLEGVNPITVLKDTVEIIGWIKKIYDFFFKLFKRKDLPTQFLFEGELYKYYSYMMDDGGTFVAGYTKEGSVQDVRFKVWSKTKIRTKNLLRKTLKEYKLL